MVVALRAERVLLPWGVLPEPQGRAGKKGSLGEPFLFVSSAFFGSHEGE
jgi:hypothetical protein